MHAGFLRCPKCKALLNQEVLGSSAGAASCSLCQTVFEFQLFPAFFRQPTPGNSGQAVQEESEASCFFHPNKRAETTCSACGRFICSLCDSSIDDERLCPVCLEAGRTKGKLVKLEKERILYDNCTLGLAVMPVVMFPAVILTAPLVLFLAFRYWRAPSSIIPRSKLRFLLAIVLALLELAGVSAFFLLR